MKYRQIRAAFDHDIIRVYQAFNHVIADDAIKGQTFSRRSFKVDRMTWIKPSLLWMMYRSGWGTKQGQERILGIDIKRSGFEWALKHSVLSHFDENIYKSKEHWKETKDNSPVRIQWDPERDINFEKLDYRSIQIGLSGVAVEKYVNEWIVNIEDLTDYCDQVKKYFINSKKKPIDLPVENPYPLSKDLAKLIGASL